MRNAFINELVTCAKNDDRIFLVVADLGYSVIEPFVDAFPDRFMNIGVAEQNMATVAAGMASEGFKVFAYSIANFPTFRCAEQIRNDIAYHDLDVTMVSVGGGLSYGNLGYSHHAVQDYGLMRLMPNLTIAAPGDPGEVRSCVQHILKASGPHYLRLAKAGEPIIRKQAIELRPGTPYAVSPVHTTLNTDTAILTTGSVLSAVSGWLNEMGSNVPVFTMPLWGIGHKETAAEFLRDFKKIITVEDHVFDCGFGSWLQEVKYGCGLDDLEIGSVALSSEVCGRVGTQQHLYSVGGLTKQALARAMERHNIEVPVCNASTTALNINAGRA